MPTGLPQSFEAADKDYALYEGIDYEQYWEQPAEARQNALEQRLIADLLPERGKRIVDIGCGYGRLAPLYLDRYDHVVLYDGSMSLLKKAAARFGGRATFVAGDVGALPFKAGAFDTGLTIRVLQHVHDLGGTLEEMRRVLAEGANFVFSYHNKRNAHRIIRLYKSSKVGSPFARDSREVCPTLISHHPRTMAELLHTAGFSSPEYRGAVVVNPLAAAAERLGATGTAGLRWAGVTGRYLLAPWLIGKSKAKGGPPLTPASSVIDLLACPSCGDGVAEGGGGVRCASCGRSYPRTHGVLDFRL